MKNKILFLLWCIFLVAPAAVSAQDRENHALYQTQNFEIKLSPEQNDQFYNMNVATFCSSQDFDNDRISDCDDRCPMSAPGQAVDMEGCALSLMADIRGVHFDFDKATLRPESVMILNEMAETLHQNPYLQIKVAGHTDSIGSRAYNKELSMRRAEAVYGYLVARGIDPSRLWGPTGYGESRPIAPNKNADGSDNPEGRAQNRRAELNVEND